MHQDRRCAQQHWTETHRQDAAGLENSEAFCSQLGSQVQYEVRARWTPARVAEPVTAGESFLDGARPFKRLRQEAESDALGELVLLPAEDDPDLLEDPDLDGAELTEEQWREHDLKDLAPLASQDTFVKIGGDLDLLDGPAIIDGLSRARDATAQKSMPHPLLLLCGLRNPSVIDAHGTPASTSVHRGGDHV